MPLVGSTGLAWCLMGALAVAQPQQPPAQTSKPTPPSPPAAPAPDSKVVTTDAVHVLVLPMKGAYLQHPAAFDRLGAFLAERGVSPDGPPIARYFSDPSVGEADLVWEVGFPVPATLKAEAPFELKDIPGSLTAVHIHQGSLEDLATAWPAFVQWVLSNGYRPAGAPMQIFQGSFGSGSQVEMRLPVEK